MGVADGGGLCVGFFMDGLIIVILLQYQEFPFPG